MLVYFWVTTWISPFGIPDKACVLLCFVSVVLNQAFSSVVPDLLCLFPISQPKSNSWKSAQILSLSDSPFLLKLSLNVGRRWWKVASFISILFWDCFATSHCLGIFQMPSNRFLKILASFPSCSQREVWFEAS